MTRFSYPPTSLGQAITRVAGPKGMLEQSAEERFGKTSEGQGGKFDVTSIYKFVGRTKTKW